MNDTLPMVEALEHRFMRAWMAKDARTLKALTSRNFRLIVGTSPSVLLDATSFLAAAGGDFRCTHYRFGDVYARRLGPLIVFATQLEMEGNVNRHDWSGPLWMTDLWQKSRVRRRWRLLERHVSRLEGDEHIPAAVRALQLWR